MPDSTGRKHTDRAGGQETFAHALSLTFPLIVQRDQELQHRRKRNAHKFDGFDCGVIGNTPIFTPIQMELIGTR